MASRVRKTTVRHISILDAVHEAGVSWVDQSPDDCVPSPRFDPQ